MSSKSGCQLTEKRSELRWRPCFFLEITWFWTEKRSEFASIQLKTIENSGQVRLQLNQTSKKAPPPFAKSWLRDWFDKVRNSEIWKSLNIEPLLLRIERSQLRWFGHVSRMPRERLPNKLYLPKQMGKDQLDDLKLDEPIIMRILDGIAWNFTQAKWWRWRKTVKCGGLISSCCPRNPHGKAGNEKRRFSETVGRNTILSAKKRLLAKPMGFWKQ